MNFSKRIRPWVIAFLSITIGDAESLTTQTAAFKHEPPFWQFILREFVFKTISPLPPRNYALYKKLLEAPFYGGPLPETSNEEKALLSRGDVYHMPDGQWILCQEGCVNCESCRQQKHPIVKWTLRKVKQMTSLGFPESALLLTVVPQIDERFQNSKQYLWPYNYVYVTTQQNSKTEGHRQHSTSTKGETFVVEKPTGENSWGRNMGKAEQHLQFSDIGQNDFVHQKTYRNHHNVGESNLMGGEYLEDLSASRKTPRNIARVERYRPKVRPIEQLAPLAYFYPRLDIARTNSLAEKLQDDSNVRLIMGIDQHGERHLVHVVPVESSANDLGSSIYPIRYQGSYNPTNSARISRTVQQSQTAPSFENLMEKILNSLNNHRNFIETFFISDRLEQDNLRNEGAIAPYPNPRRKSNDERPDRTNFAGYGTEISPRANQYPIGSDYRIEDQDEQFRRYADMSPEVNRPAGEYQDQNLMIEYDRYGDDSQDERPLPAGVNRRHRNSFPKLMNLTTRNHKSQNHSQMNTPDTVFFINRELVENSTTQAVAESKMTMD